jgi:hypothetical protein
MSDDTKARFQEKMSAYFEDVVKNTETVPEFRILQSLPEDQEFAEDLFFLVFWAEAHLL